MLNFEEKIKLAEQIKKIKCGATLNEIHATIKRENPSVAFTHTIRGIYCYFHDLSDDTYDKIAVIVGKYYETRRKRKEIKLHIPKSLLGEELNSE